MFLNCEQQIAKHKNEKESRTMESRAGEMASERNRQLCNDQEKLNVRNMKPYMLRINAPD